MPLSEWVKGRMFREAAKESFFRGQGVDSFVHQKGKVGWGNDLKYNKI
jgi:hypothetical protein